MNNEYPEDWGIGFDPIDIGNFNLIPVKKIKDLIIKIVNRLDDVLDHWKLRQLRNL